MVHKTFVSLRPFIKPTATAFAIILLAYLAIIRGGISYIDDMGRSATGYAWMHDFHRYSSSLVSYILNLNVHLTDISPIPQLIGILLLSISCVVIAYVLSNKRINTITLIASVILGIAPYTVLGMVFKFDSICMALGMLASIVPIIFWGKLLDQRKLNRRIATRFIIFATLSLLVMWTSYQALAGVYVVVVLGVALNDLINDRCNWKSLLKNICLYAVPYVLATLVFLIISRVFGDDGYRETNMYTLSEIIGGFAYNALIYAKSFIGGLNCVQLILIMLLITLGAVSSAIRAKTVHKRIVNIVLYLLYVAIGFLVSYGCYLVLEGAPTSGRAMMGVSVWIAIISILAVVNTTNILKRIGGGILCALVVSFLVAANSFGNGLVDQNRYAEFRISNLINELNQLNLDVNSLSKKRIRLIGDIGNSRVMENVLKDYPVYNSFDSGLNGNGVWGYYLLTKYDKWPMQQDVDDSLICVSVKLRTAYDEISQDGDGNICVKLNDIDVQHYYKRSFL